MARTDPQVNIRMPQETKDRLELAAKESGRSLNSEIIARLQQTFEPPPPISQDLVARIAKLLIQEGQKK